MPYKRILTLLVAWLFLMAAVTFYLNRVIFPHLVKDTAVAYIQKTLNRRVEIGSIHFNWVKGFIIDKIKIYEQNTPTTVFAQAQELSFGLMFFPGFKHGQLTILFLNVASPSAHLRRTAENTWNFNTLLSALTSNANTTSLRVTCKGINIYNGTFLIEDHFNPHPWSEYLDHVDLRLSLSYQGIGYAFTANLPRNQGHIAATAYYQPITHSTQAHIHLQNIDTASYASLIPDPDWHLTHGFIQDIDVNIHHGLEEISLDGSVLVNNLDIMHLNNRFKGSLDIHGIDAHWAHQSLRARGFIALSNITAQVADLNIQASLQTNIDALTFTPNSLMTKGSCHAQKITLTRGDQTIHAQNFNADNIEIRKTMPTLEATGTVLSQNLSINTPAQDLQGDILFKNILIQRHSLEAFTVQGTLQATHLSTRIFTTHFNTQNMLLENILFSKTDSGHITSKAELSLETPVLVLNTHRRINATSIKTHTLSLALSDDLLQINTTLNAINGQFTLSPNQYMKANPQIELNVHIPLNHWQQLSYSGSITLADGHIQGFYPLPALDNIELDADFQKDKALLNALSLTVEDTNVRINGKVENFTHPWLDITAEADEFNLNLLERIFPQFTQAYGLHYEGSSVIKTQFQGELFKPSQGKVFTVATVKNAAFSSRAWHQDIHNITGIVEIEPDQITTRDCTLNYNNQPYAVSGIIRHFENPEIHATIHGTHLDLNTTILKNKNILTFTNMHGNYFNASFNETGTVIIYAHQEPAFNVHSHITLLAKDLSKIFPFLTPNILQATHPEGLLTLDTDIQGLGLDWKKASMHTTISSAILHIADYSFKDMRIVIDAQKNNPARLALDAQFYNGTLHAQGSLDPSLSAQPYDVALKIDNVDLHQLKMVSPLRMEDINGKLFLNAQGHGNLAHWKTSLEAHGLLVIKEGFLGEFYLFKGLLSVLNSALHLDEVLLTGLSGSFNLKDAKIMTDDLEIQGPTLSLVGKGWADFNNNCHLNITVDLSASHTPADAYDVLRSMDVLIYGNMAHPKFKNKISMPQVINSLFKNLL